MKEGKKDGKKENIKNKGNKNEENVHMCNPMTKRENMKVGKQNTEEVFKLLYTPYMVKKEFLFSRISTSQGCDSRIYQHARMFTSLIPYDMNAKLCTQKNALLDLRIKPLAIKCLKAPWFAKYMAYDSIASKVYF